MNDILIIAIADWLVVPIIGVTGLALLRLPRTQWYDVGARIFFAGLVAFFIAKMASLVYQGERPFVTLGAAPKAAYLDNPGFPSDHALLVVFCAVIVWLVTKRPAWAAIVGGMAALVCIGRVLALVHTPADVAGGIVAAFAAGMLVYGRDFFSRRRIPS